MASRSVNLAKLFVPPPSTNWVERPRLTAILDLQRPLTIVSAPTGFGKTSLVSGWLPTQALPYAWLGLDEQDNSAIRLMTHLISAIQTIAPDFGEAILGRLQQTTVLALAPLMQQFCNEALTVLPPSVLVLDDAHVLASSGAQEILLHLIQLLPQQLHLVLTTREDPPIALGRVRMQGGLAEIRADGLRCTLEESHLVLKMLGVELTLAQLERLETRTEGWLAGLQLAGLALQSKLERGRGRHKSADKFIEQFSGGHRYIFDYLIEEVLSQQSQELQAFLLQTSILDQFSSDLCNAVVNRADSHSQIVQLERANLFLIALDEDRSQYRYHHLFRDLLQQQLSQTQLTLPSVRELHLRAHHWFAKQNQLDEAVRHGVAGEWWEESAELIENHTDQLFFQGELHRLRNWFSLLPKSVIASRNKLFVNYIWMCILANDIEKAFAWLEETPAPDDGPEMACEIHTAFAYLYQVTSDPQNAIFHGEKALAFDAQTSGEPMSNLQLVLGLAYRTQGIFEKSLRHLRVAAKLFRAEHHVYGEHNAIATAAEIYIQLGQVEKSISLLHELEPRLPNGLWPYGDGVLSASLYWSNQLDAANKRGQQALEKMQNTGGLIAMPNVRIVQARLLVANGKVQEAFDLIQKSEIEANDHQTYIPLLAYQIDLLLMLNRVSEARIRIDRLVETLDVSNQSKTSLVLSALRVQLAEHKAAKMFVSLNQQLKQTEERDFQQISLLVLKAAALLQLNQPDEAAAAIQSGFELGSRHRLTRLMADELMIQRDLARFCRQINLLSQLDKFRNDVLNLVVPMQSRTQVRHLDRLTTREKELIGLLIEGLSNPEIGRKLTISRSTVKRHLSNIYEKLSVRNRAEAIVKAQNDPYL